MKNKRSLTSILLIGFVLLVGLYFWSTKDQQQSEQDTSESTSDTLTADSKVDQVTFLDERRIQKQYIQEQDLLQEYESEDYTLTDPFIELDPYNTMPLSAVMIFETEEPVQVQVEVEGTDENTSIEHTYEDFNTVHQIPILGLYPDAENTVIVTTTNQKDEKTTEEFTIETDPLPEDFIQPEIVEAKPEKMEDGLSFMIPTKKYTYAVDSNADVRWYSTLPVKLAYERLRNGNLLFASQDEAQNQYNELVEMDLLGKVYNSYIVEIDGYDNQNPIHHDVIELPNGNLLATVHEPDSDYVEDHMIEINRKTGITEQWTDLRSVFHKEAYEEYDGKNADSNDWLHQNAVWFDYEQDDILVSGRSQDSILKLSYPKNDLQWILAEHEDWPDSHQEYLLEPIGDVKFPAGQHAMEIIPPKDEKDDDLIDVLLFDNNTVITRGDKDISDTYSQAIHYQINEKEKTVEEIWAYGKDRGEDFFSSIIGNTQYLPKSETILITSGAIRPVESDDGMMESRIVEVSHDDEKEVVFEVKTPEFPAKDSRYIYRSVRMPLYPELNWSFSFGKP